MKRFDRDNFYSIHWFNLFSWMHFDFHIPYFLHRLFKGKIPLYINVWPLNCFNRRMREGFCWCVGILQISSRHLFAILSDGTFSGDYTFRAEDIWDLATAMGLDEALEVEIEAEMKRRWK
jgi:hypothetical protein